MLTLKIKVKVKKIKVKIKKEKNRTCVIQLAMFDFHIGDLFQNFSSPHTEWERGFIANGEICHALQICLRSNPTNR